MDTRFFYVCLLSCLSCFSQKEETPKSFTIDANPFYGSIMLHNTDISHLINAHPAGVILGFNKKNFGSKEWHQEYNYPDTGISFVYQDMNDAVLGKNYSLYAHYNFYFF